jgi:hypothetical protein
MSSRVWKILAAIALLAQPAWSQGTTLDIAELQRDIAAGNALVEQWIGCTQGATAKLAGFLESVR